MDRGTFLKFLFLSYSNIKKYFLINLILLIPLGVMIYSFSTLLPLALRYINSFSIIVQDVSQDYTRLAVVVISDLTGARSAYVFDRAQFNSVRKYIFQSSIEEKSRELLREKAAGYRDVPAYMSSVSLADKSGKHLMDIFFEDSRENVVDVLFVNTRRHFHDENVILFAALFAVGFILFSGSLGGVCDYTQRIVFHEIKGFRYLFTSLQRYFYRSLFISFFFTIVIGAIITNIYFYIFIINSDTSVFIAAINFWMLVFFIFILFWVYPLMILGGEETVWKIMRKSLFISFDNFQYTRDAVFFMFLMMIASCATCSLMPGAAGMFSFLNSALKEISSRYTDSDSA